MYSGESERSLPTHIRTLTTRHSDHKLEMTSAEFREWATSAAADWGYRVEISGVGVSSSPSYYPADHPTPHQPIYASQVALFRLGSGIPARSPRSVRSTELPWLSKEDNHPHKLVGRFTHPATITGQKEDAAKVADRVGRVMAGWKVGSVSLSEIWGDETIARMCGGSKRYLVGCLGGYGDRPAVEGLGERAGEFKVDKDDNGLVYIVWNGYKPEVREEEKEWGVAPSRTEASTETGGW